MPLVVEWDTTLRFAMVPLDVLTDDRLRHLDVRVYGILAGSRSGSMVTMGMRLLAQRVHGRRRMVAEGIRRLEECGYLEVRERGKGKRGVYWLTGSQFKGGDGGKVESVVDAEPGKKKVGVVICPRCHKRCRGLIKVGYCRGCAWEAKVRRIADQSVADAEKRGKGHEFPALEEGTGAAGDAVGISGNNRGLL